MLKQVFVINFPEGLHMRPASELSKIAGKQDCDVTLKVGGNKINAKSVIGIVAACIKFGSEVELICNGVDEAEAMENIKMGFASGLGEK